MSSARRLQEDYRRIIGLQDETRGLDDDLPRMRIGGQRGIWQIGNNELKTGNAGGEDEDGNAVDPVTPDEGSENSNSDGSGGGGGGTDPSNDLEPETINPEDPPAGVDVDSDTFGGDWASGGAKSFVDCETNQCIELVEVGGYVPPEGWDDADNGPLPEGYEEGFYFMFLFSANARGYTPCDALIAGYPTSSNLSDGSTLVTEYNGGCVASSLTSNGFVTFNIKEYIRFSTGEKGPESFISGVTRNYTRINCGINNTDFCGDTAKDPHPEFWPSDNCIQLAPNSEGNWQASNKENPADMTAKYSEAKSQLTLCTPSGDTVEIYKRFGGGHVYFNSDQGIWAGSDSSGRIRSFGSSSTLDQEIARPRN